MASITSSSPTPIAREQFWRPRSTVQRIREAIIEKSLFLCGLLSIAVTASIAGIVFYESYEFFQDAEYHQLQRDNQHFAAVKIAAIGGMVADASGNQLVTIPVTAAGYPAHEARLAPTPLGRERVSLSYFLTGDEWTAGFQQARFGILPLLTGTLMVAVIAAVIALPMGLTIAIYLSEYARPRVRRFAKPTLELLAGVPTIVYGYFALVTLTPFLQNFIELKAVNQLSGGMVVGIMILPMVASLSEDALRAVPRSLRDASLALGANKFETSMRVVVPAALSGIIASFILAISRAVGETMAVSIACGMEPKISFDPREGAATMTSFIVAMATGDAPHTETRFKSLFAVAAMLFLVTLTMNVIAQGILRRFRQVYQ